ncbi:MAG: DNA replication/repair protein RecF [Acidihalobacter sp.]|uniref:DNA replication/repair protein RecF n=1 Tax=Acidihalobacter sp. TaxID=1872108 RepID=UPI00307FA05D
MLLELAGENLRNLSSFSISPGKGLNIVVGGNAAGKTSLLEAIYILSLGRTFRTTRLDEAVRSGSGEAWVRGKVSERGAVQTTRLGIARSKGQTLCRIDGRNVSSAAELAMRLPVQILHPDSHRLLSGSPAHRRAFIDWGCFYQDSRFFSAWSRFRRVLSQRNAALKQRADVRVLSGIEAEFCLASEQIDALRKNYIDGLCTSLRHMNSLWPSDSQWELEYRRGWSEDRTLAEVLVSEREQARRVGHSLAGPQRADLIVKSDEERVARMFSRGQLKRAAAALLLSQVLAFELATDRDVLMLVDDLPSELDAEAREVLLTTLVERQRQCFVTALSPKDLNAQMIPEHRMFHVEHGRLSELV